MLSVLEEMMNKIARLPEKERAEFEKFITESTKDKIWVPNPGPQTDAYISKADEVFYGGSAGGGKLQGINNLVLTPTGWIRFGDLKIGSKLCATDGGVTEVTGIYPQGIVDLYKITMRDGGVTHAGLDHNWLAWRTHALKKTKNERINGIESAAKWTTAEIKAEMEMGSRFDGRRRSFAIPVSSPVAFNVAGQLKGRGNFVGREVNPYLLGLLLGDGHATQYAIGITTADPEIANYIIKLANDDARICTKENNAAATYLFRGETRKKLSVALTRLGLIGCGAADKFIPRQYLFAPTEDRWELFRGLMDTDGWVEEKRACYYTTISSSLANDVEHLARSLGAVTTRTEKYPTYTYKGEKFTGQLAYCVRIKLPEPTMAFSLPRKKKIAATIQHQSISRIIDKIEFSHREEALCIRVRHKNSLYITDDFIVTHNTDLALGLALTQHERSLIIREYLDDARSMAERMLEIVKTRDGWNGQLLQYRNNNRSIDFGGCRNDDEKQRYKGKPHDLIVFDEVSDILESVYTFIIAWNRSTKQGQRCRVIATGNPPTEAKGLWVIKRWAAWLDPRHHNPAKPGELRWYVNIGGEDKEVDGRGPHLINGEEVYARSRTFIRAKLSDNWDLAQTDYDANLAALPEAYRLAYREGRFDLSLNDAANQCIPTAWVKAAQSRWVEWPPEDVPMCTVGVDASGGGTDPMIIAKRYDGWFAPLVKINGKDIPMDSAGAYSAGMVISNRRDNATVVVDMGGGYGGPLYEHLAQNGIKVIAYKGAEATTRRSADGKLKFTNKRSAAYWYFREALDPGQPGGSPISLPDDNELVADLTTPTFKVTPNGIQLERKEDVVKRIGRSPDKGDAVVMAWFEGPRETTAALEWAEKKERKSGIRNVILGRRQPLSARRR